MRPNGLAFSPDERRLYVSDTGATHVPDGPRHIRVFDVGDDGALSRRRGLRHLHGRRSSTASASTTDGRLWTSAGDGVHCYDPDGTLLGKILVPEAVANVVFGGPKRNRLFICATTSLYSVMLGVNGATRPQLVPTARLDLEYDGSDFARLVARSRGCARCRRRSSARWRRSCAARWR